MPNPMMWIYHPTEPPAMVPATDRIPDGWADTPAAFKTHTDRTDDLIAMFRADPYRLTKDEHVQLGRTLGLTLDKRRRESALIQQIQKVVGNGDDEATD